MRTTKNRIHMLLAVSAICTSTSFAASKPNWKIAVGEFETTVDSIKATGKENYVWAPDMYENFELQFLATKAPKSDFRVNIGSASPQSTGRQGTFYQILIPWEGGDSRIDYFNNGRVTHITRGLKNIEKQQYQVRLVMKDQLLKVWIDDDLQIEIILREYEKGYIGFSSMEGICAEKIQITK